MYWIGRPAESRDLATEGLRYASGGQQAARLHLSYVRAAARLGDTDAVRRAIDDAHDAHDRGHGDELADMGGEYTFSWATHHCYAGAALAGLGGAHPQAAAELEQAIGLYDKGPGDREQHWSAGQPLASIDLAVVRLRSGALDAAATALEPVFRVQPGQRITQLTTRLAAVRNELAAPIYRTSAQAREVSEHIEEFTREAAICGFRSCPG